MSGFKTMTAGTKRILAARESGAVKRCHVIPHFGEYTNAGHCYNCVSMLLILHPEPSVDLITALLWHDGGERWVGDMPSFAKEYNPALSEQYKVAEERALKHWGLSDGLSALTNDDLNWLNSVDKLELWLWCHDQAMFGNRHHLRVMENLTAWFEKNMKSMPNPCQEFYRCFEWRRLPDPCE